MAKERFCAEVDCGRLVVDEEENKCSKHRVNVGDHVSLVIVVREVKDEFTVGSGEVTEIDDDGLVHVNLGEKVGLHELAFPSRLFRRDGAGRWDLKAEMS